MQEITATIAIVASSLVILLDPVWGLGIFYLALGWYPSYLSFPVGGVNFTVGRVIIIAIYLNLFLRGRHELRLIWLDKWMAAFFIAMVGAGLFTTEMGELLQNRSGAAFDFLLPYFAVRLTIRTQEDFNKLLKIFVLAALPLAAVGFYECLTGRNPVGFLRQYYSWGGAEADSEYVPIRRHGFFRASVTFPMSIMFGLFFSMLGPLIVGMWANRRLRKIAIVGSLIMAAGVFDSMSSGPMFGALLATVFMMVYRYRRFWRWPVGIAILACAAIEIISNRHFYDVLGRFTLSPETAWYRSKLLDVALYEGGMSGHWILGYGLADPGWGAKIDMRENTDIVNNFLLVLCLYGIVGLVPFLGIIYEAFASIGKALKVSATEAQRRQLWSMAASLFGMCGAMFSVSLFGQPITTFFTVIALCGCMPAITEQESMRIMAQTDLYEYGEEKQPELQHANRG